MSGVEEWRPVLGYEGLYEVSSLGRIKSLAREVRVRGGGRSGTQRTKKLPERIRKPFHRPNGYLDLILSREGDVAAHMVHALVCAAFHGPRPPGHEVAHNDGDQKNNDAKNLRWATPAENNSDKIAHGTSRRGSDHPFAILTEGDVAEIRSRLGRVSMAELARQYGVGHNCIYNIKKRRTWKHVPG